MSDPKAIKKRILTDVEKQVDALIESSEGSPRSLYELEKEIVKIGEQAKKRIAEEIIKYQQEKSIKKKTARNAAGRSTTKDCDPGKY